MKSLPHSRVRRLLELTSDALVRLYSYQGRVAWDRAVERGHWTGSDHVYEDGEHGFGPAYDWMRGQMAEHVSGFSGELPMWAWAKCPCTKPAPKRYRGIGDDLRLTVLVPRSRVLFSDYDSWHCVLNRTLNCTTEAEWDQHSTRFPHHWSFGDDEYKGAYLASIAPSWANCLSFQLSANADVISWTGNADSFQVQACVDRFHWNEIVGVPWFGAGPPA